MLNIKDKYQVAYFSMEIALENALKTYAGGLGILAGDLLRSASSLKFPMLGISLINRQGYFKQELTEDGQEIVKPDSDYDFSKLKKLDLNVEVKIGQEIVKVGVWEYLIKGENNFFIPVYFLDTNVEGNSSQVKQITDQLYGRNKEYRLKQEIVLGRAGVKILKKLGYYNIKKYHLNEGHGALATVELFLDFVQRNALEKDNLKKIEEFKKQIVFTTHTPLKREQDVFSLEYFKKEQSDFPDYLPGILDKNLVNLTKLALYFSFYTNAVSKLHQKVTAKMFPNYKIEAITNGVNSSTWTSSEFKALYDKYCPGWRKDASLLIKAQNIPLQEIWQAHQNRKKILIDYLNKHSNQKFTEKDFLLSFARRFTAYKRPTFLFNNLKKLVKAQKQNGPIQIVYAGKAHPNDLGGQKLIKKIYEFKKELESEIKIVFLENYDMNLAKLLVSGSDLWLNTPLPPNEASGTSGMKAAHNGLPQFSTIDGWWAEAQFRNKTGWTIIEKKRFYSNKINSNFYKLLKEILINYYHYPQKWQEFMRNAISINASYFNTDRALKQYIKEAYKL